MLRIFVVPTAACLWSGPATAQQQPSPTRTLTAAETSGRSIFQTRCAMCHVGQEPATELATEGARRPATLGPVLSKVHVANETMLRQKIRDGSRLMPGYKHTLTDDQIGQVIAFMKTLDQPLTRLMVARPGPAAPSTQSAEEGLLTGTINSASGKPLEGVAVSAQRPGDPIATSVYTDADGHLRYEEDTPLTNLYVSMLEKLGIPTETFGDSTGSAPHLSEV